MSGFASRLAEAIENLVRNGIIINPIEILIQLVATVVLIVLVKQFLWDKVTAFLDARQSVVDEDIATAQADKEKAQALREKAENEMQSIKEEAKAILDAAKEQAKNQRENTLAKTQEDVDAMRKQAENEITKDIENARKSLREEIIGVAMVLSKKVVAKEIDEATYMALIDEAIEEVSHHE
jgi:F-type H+-transporting ATPase subunit b